MTLLFLLLTIVFIIFAVIVLREALKFQILSQKLTFIHYLISGSKFTLWLPRGLVYLLSFITSLGTKATLLNYGINVVFSAALITIYLSFFFMQWSLARRGVNITKLSYKEFRKYQQKESSTAKQRKVIN